MHPLSRLSLATLLLASGFLVPNQISGQLEEGYSELDGRRSALATQGIVVPKRSSLISGLNQQFKLRADKQQVAANSSSASQQQQQQLQQQTPAQQQQPIKSPANILEANLQWLASRGHNNQQRRKLQNQQLQQSLYLDRHQQQILAANPNLLNPSNLPSSLLTRSDAELAMQSSNSNHHLLSAGQHQQFGSNNLTAAVIQLQQQQQQKLQQQQTNELNGQQLYRGFSLIELEVKTDADRRYIQELYGNLSAALNEQAQNPNALTVSPYVDVDFWSFKYGLNDQIDIMVSPKSRSFIMGQLSRAKIRHRVKIDDIQSRLDQQLPGASGQQPAGAGDSQLSGRGGQSGSVEKREAHLDSRQAPGADQQVSGGSTGAGNAGSSSPSGKPMNDSLFFDNYQRLADINQYMESLVERNRDIARVKVIGRSSQGRYLRVLKLGYDQQDVDGRTSPSSWLSSASWSSESLTGRQPTVSNASSILDSFFQKQESSPKLGSIWLDGGTHAREWISPSTVLYIAHRLSDNHNRCAKLFDTLRLAVTQANALAAAHMEKAARSGRQFPQLMVPSAPTNLEPELLTGINEINTSLLGKPAQPIRPRTELERTLEQLAKSPQEVASEYGCDLNLDQLLRRYTFHIMPVLNPDGYEYSHTHNRLWRKTRSTSNHPIYRHFCLGADPNRNYDARHGATGSSTHPCSQTYAGTVPFTEPETRHQSNFVYANRLAMKMFISFHSYSQMILLPYSHSKQLAPDHKDLESVGLAAVKAIEQTHGTVYRVGPSASILYTASGTASDWAYEKAGIKYSYTIELRDTGTYGFLLPRQQILPTGEETFNGLLAMIAQMEKNDNLLQSKSLLGLAANQAKNLTSSLEVAAGLEPESIDFSHVPDMDHLRPLSKQRAKPGLENVLEGSSSWPDAAAGPTGVRDRPIVGNRFESDSFETSSHTELVGHRLEEESVGDDNAPDSGYAFEGEGELMEPTRENIVEAAKMSNMKLTGRHDHTRRITQSAGLTASGRNFINSPLLKGRLDIEAPKRESSNDMNEAKALKL